MPDARQPGVTAPRPCVHVLIPRRRHPSATARVVAPILWGGSDIGSWEPPRDSRLLQQLRDLALRIVGVVGLLPPVLIRRRGLRTGSRGTSATRARSVDMSADGGQFREYAMQRPDSRWGRAHLDFMRRHFGHFVAISCNGETLARQENFVHLDPDVRVRHDSRLPGSNLETSEQFGHT